MLKTVASRNFPTPAESTIGTSRCVEDRHTIAALEASRLILRCSKEWSALPVSGTRCFAPLMLIWFEWWEICLWFAVASLVWQQIRTHWVSLRIATFSALLNNMLVCISINFAFAAAFFVTGAMQEAVVSLIWYPITAALAVLYRRTDRAEIEEKLWSQMLKER